MQSFVVHWKVQRTFSVYDSALSLGRWHSLWGRTGLRPRGLHWQAASQLEGKIQAVLSVRTYLYEDMNNNSIYLHFYLCILIFRWTAAGASGDCSVPVHAHVVVVSSCQKESVTTQFHQMGVNTAKEFGSNTALATWTAALTQVQISQHRQVYPVTYLC